MKKVSVLGAGAFGTAMAQVLADSGCTVLLWCHEQEVADVITTQKRNSRYMPDIKLSDAISATIDLSQAFAYSSIIFEAIPVSFLRSVLEKATIYYDGHVIVLLSKGIEQRSLALPTQIIDEIFATTVKKAVVSGPNFAQELLTRQPSATVVASDDEQLATTVAQLLATTYMRPFISSDVVGVQVGAALKNIIALAVGMVQGAGYGSNTVCFLVTRALAELAAVAQQWGGHAQTVYGLSGVGDMILTGLGGLSRNAKAGNLFAQGGTLDQIKEELGVLPEGVNTVQSLYEYTNKHKLILPICSGVYDVVFKGVSVTTFVEGLVQGPIIHENITVCF